MLKQLAACALVLGITACSNPETTKAVKVGTTETCAAYGRALMVAIRMKPKLTAQQIAIVDHANSVVVPICTAPNPPDISSVNAITEQLMAVLAVTGQGA